MNLNLEAEDIEEAKLCGVILANGSKSDRDCPKILPSYIFTVWEGIAKKRQ